MRTSQKYKTTTLGGSLRRVIAAEQSKENATVRFVPSVGESLKGRSILDYLEHIDRLLHNGKFLEVDSMLDVWAGSIRTDEIDTAIAVLLGTSAVSDRLPSRKRLIDALEPVLVEADGTEDAGHTIAHLRAANELCVNKSHLK